MKITEIKTYVVPAHVSDSEWAFGKAFVLVKVETDGSLSGWGEAYVPNDCELAVAALVDALARYLEGNDVPQIAQFRHNALHAFATLQTGLHFSCAVAGIETALWDLQGKAQAQPVYQLLGGACREAVPVYANCHTNKDFPFEDVIDYAKSQHAAGFNQVKVYPFLNHTGVHEGLAQLSQLRESLPPECAILVDAWRALDYESAKYVLNTLEAMGIRWLEDPVPTEDLQSLARLAETKSVDIVTGETLSDEAGFSHLLNHRAADILNPDITCVGLSTITSMAASARATSCKVAVHNFNSMGPALAASLSAGAAIQNLAGVEYFSRFKAGTEVFCRLNWQQTQDGSFTLSKEPGLGISVDESILADFDYRPAAKRPWPG
tara:strand:- start:5126 stop:6259 length:1134 start_codon:yes stop_codon:yes gene_type:complete